MKAKAITKEFESQRNNELIKLVDRLKRSPFKPTGVKIELEGGIGRRNRCGANCSFANEGEPHEGCKCFSDTRVANDFVLAYLEQFGLSKKLPRQEWGTFRYSYVYVMTGACAFSRVYTDCETEWTITIRLDKSENVLVLPHLIDAFNALAKANGTKKINVDGAGMHTAFIQGKNGMYPAENNDQYNNIRFKNFSKSMTPLLPALYFLGSNRMSRGKAITRSFGPRQPAVSNADKYSAVAYRGGALEFRVFDTCYDDREHVLDNVAVMARSVAKYWRREYRSPAVDKYLTKPVYFGNTKWESINKLEDLFTVKEQIQLLNEGLRRLKPNYYSISDIKLKRKFKKTQNTCKQVNLDKHRDAYKKYLNRLNWDVQWSVSRDMYNYVDSIGYNSEQEDNIEEKIEKARQDILARTLKARKPKEFEAFATELETQGTYCVGGKA